MAAVAERLSLAGCVAPEDEAAELLVAAGGDAARLEVMVGLRVEGEPLAWVTGSVRFAGHDLWVDRGVFIPRQQTALLVAVAVDMLPEAGVAIDLCTGTGAVAAALSRARPGARVAATDISPSACACAGRNGVEVYAGDLDAPLPDCFRGRVDVVTAVAPYVPTDCIKFLPSDFRDHEPLEALDGGTDGLAVLERVVAAAGRLLRPGGWLVVEVGADQDGALAGALHRAGFGPVTLTRDEDGDLRVLRASLR